MKPFDKEKAKQILKAHLELAILIAIGWSEEGIEEYTGGGGAFKFLLFLLHPSIEIEKLFYEGENNKKEDVEKGRQLFFELDKPKERQDSYI